MTEQITIEKTETAQGNGHGKVNFGEGVSVVTPVSKYTTKLLSSYDRERHVLVDDAYTLVESQSNLSRGPLERALESGNIHVYDFNGKQYLDRLDVGRVFHKPTERKGLTIERYFTTEGKDPLEDVEYEAKDVVIKDYKTGETIFQMNEALFPKTAVPWTDEQAAIVAQKYFYKPSKEEWRDKIKDKIGIEHENSVAHLVGRVSKFFGEEGAKLGYFATEEDKAAFIDELNYLQINRMAAFNSPVYFNAGLYEVYGVEGSPGINYFRDSDTGEVKLIKDGGNIRPQNHACFIKAPRDDLASILHHVVDEGITFSSGSGIGGDIGALREEGALLSSGGKASGPMSFFGVYDDEAGTIKSGGKSRRAARMQTIRYHHPDALKFINAKPNEDKKALILMQNGFSGGMDGEAYTTVAFQNTNLSVRLDDYFFDQVEKDGKIQFKSVKDGKVIEEYPARDMLKRIAFGSWRIGDPGIQFEDRIQEDHTCPNSGKQNSTNPCGEYMFLNDTSCNLASTNVAAFSDKKGNFNVEKFSRANRIIAIAQDIANHASSYPIEDIARISPEFGTIGLGYSNVGTLLMRRGLAYDSEEGRAFVSALTALMTANAFETSAEMAENLGTFIHYEFNRDPMLKVVKNMGSRLEKITQDSVPQDLKLAAVETWERVQKKGEKYGFRNAQNTVLAPTGTISFLMGCDTSGIEPAIALSAEKELAGGGKIQMVNQEIPNALRNLGYTDAVRKKIEDHIKENNTIEGCPDIKPEHRPIFHTSFGNQYGIGAIPFNAHLGIVAAAQPFVTGGISKTLNLQENATVKDIYEGFRLGHKLGMKGMTVFRNNSKPIYAIGFGSKNHTALKRGEKEELPTRRSAYEMEFEILQKENGIKTPFHVIVSEYPDGRPGQITFLSYTAGSAMGALLRTEGISASKSLKRGIGLEEVVKAWRDQEFEPRGAVIGHPFIKTCLSPLDLAARALLLEYTGDLDAAQSHEMLIDPKTGEIDLSTLRGFNNGAFRTYDRLKVDDWDFDSVMKDPEYGGFAPQKKKLAPVHKNGSNKRGVICACGRIMDQIGPNCFQCSKCSHKIGGCGA